MTTSESSLPVYLMDPVDHNSAENQALKKYAQIMRRNLKGSDKTKTRQPVDEVSGRPPFDMHSAADGLEDLANGVVKYPLLDVSMQGPQLKICL